MYDPREANKLYLTLLKEKGLTAAIQSTVYVVIMYFFNLYFNHIKIPSLPIVIVFLTGCCYYTWKPKLIRFLRGKLRGEEFRDKAD
ncbi:MAG: hypothetical protein H0U57_05905 [Tatlockia sp.]|nr:hypothetical protein [Tatlockia sp.]